VLGADSSTSTGLKWVAPGGSVTRRVSLLNGTVAIDANGDTGVENSAVLFSNDTRLYNVFRFGASNVAQPTAKAGIYGAISIPHDYAGTAKVGIVWSSTLTSGDVAWDFNYDSPGGDDAETTDPSAATETVTGTDTAPSAANRRLEKLLTLTSANLAADDLFQWRLTRDGTAGGDTLAGSVYVHDVFLEYTT
jgi:hypothetical protein